MRSLIHSCVAALVVLAIAAAAAYADSTIYAGPPNSFYGGDVTIAQGEKSTFTNLDTVDHDVTAAGKGADGKPLFASDKVGTGGSAPVTGVETLAAGSYAYICSIHPFMKGTITVTGSGMTPGGGGSNTNGGSPPPSGEQAAKDTTAPKLSVKVLDKRRAAVGKRKALKVALNTNEASTVSVTVRSGKTTIAAGSGKLSGAGQLALRLTKAGASAVKKSKALKLSVTARAKDAAGNASAATAAGRLS